MHLCEIFDEEVVRSSVCAASLKTKWWKRAHARFGGAVSRIVELSQALEDPPQTPAYTWEWNAYILQRVRQAAVRWRESLVWQSTTTANNEFEIDQIMDGAGFTVGYLLG
jgi:hypothetical protein